MYQKWDKAIRTLEQILEGQQKPAVFREGVCLIFCNFLQKLKLLNAETVHKLVFSLSLNIHISKAISVTGHGGLYGCEMLRIPHCLDNQLTDGG
jgi:hypothetical protein